MLIAILPYELRHIQDLCKVSVDQLVFPLGLEGTEYIKTVKDLGKSDHLIINCCSMAFRRNHGNVNCKISLIMREPRAVQKRYYYLAPLFGWKFFRILTYDQTLLRLMNNAVMVTAGDSWVPESRNTIKPKLLSVIASEKRQLPGHKLRHQAIKLAQELAITLDTFGRAYQPIENKRDALHDYKFSLVIENSRHNNYFTEKIVDCFLQKTIPIYWGAPNISEFFNKDGIIECATLDDIKEVFINLKHSDYGLRVDAIEVNLEIAKESYSDWCLNAAKALRSSMLARHP